MRLSPRLRLPALALAASLLGAPSCRPAPLLAPPEAKDSARPVEGPESPLIALPPAPELSPAGHTLILAFETGGQSGYDPRPEWPKGESGFTVGVGYDCGYFSRAAIGEDWHALPGATLTRIESAAGVKGMAALPYVQRCHDILIAWGTATDVFDRVDVSRTWTQCVRAFPGFDALRPNAQAALVSLVFNRGASMVGANRREMRAIRADVPGRDYDAIANQFRIMTRVWAGTDIYSGMKRRRYAEAELVETP